MNRKGAAGKESWELSGTPWWSLSRLQGWWPWRIYSAGILKRRVLGPQYRIKKAIKILLPTPVPSTFRGCKTHSGAALAWHREPGTIPWVSSALGNGYHFKDMIPIPVLQRRSIREGGGSTNRLWWDPSGMCRKGSRMDWHPCTQAVLKEKAGWGKISGLKWWQKNTANCSSWHYLPSVKWRESLRKMKHATVSFILNGRAVETSPPQPKCIAFYRPSVNYDCHYSVSLATVLQKHQWLLETGFLKCPWNRTQSTMWLLVFPPCHGIIWVPLTTGVLLWLSVITSSRPSPIGRWLYFLGLESFGNGILSWLFWGHSQATFRYYFKSQRFPTIKVHGIIARPVRDVSRTQMNAGDSSEFYIHCIFFYTNILIMKFNVKTVQ